ncbi:hypothetical protein [Massilia sp. CCM 8734]|uniref:hypothetical protein n=1 Tax=Massilia sp. CCM 8734 TaxID=2609283 RepID=UPI00141E45DD|nr:hypothetical protein [Massilia sp. CCM 8734]NHZ98452.1 hypothetical protein [Massilia sp. CCM 8734]
MSKEHMKIDLTYARSPLYVRQTVALAFGIPLGQEFTWHILRDRICGLPASALPKSITFTGLSQMSMIIREESENLSAFLRELRRYHPHIEVWITILD